MDNITYDTLNWTPNNDDNDAYSKLSTAQQVSTSHLQTPIQLQDKSDRVQREFEGVNNNSSKNPAQRQWSRRKAVLVAVVLLVAIILLTSLVSFAISIVTYARLISNDHSKINQDLSSQTQLAATQINMSQILTQLDRINQDLLSVKSQLPQLDAKISNIISTVRSEYANVQTQLYCGPGQWRRVAYLNMTDPTKQCPPAWRLYNNSRVRACGRPVSASSCAGMNYSTNYKYSRVCGRVIGYQVASPDAFVHHGNNEDIIEPDGITITHDHGPQRSHIWSYVASYSEMSHGSNCPCNGGSPNGPPQDIIGSNYYCESGNPNNSFVEGKLYSNDKLWDGQQCDSEGTCCSGTDSTKSPPWFSVRLPAPTNDSIEVRICCDQDTNDEDTPIELIELFVD